LVDLYGLLEVDAVVLEFEILVHDGFALDEEQDLRK
jgi:hypothetical protein